MIKVSEYFNLYVNFDSAFEASIFDIITRAYKLGADQKDGKKPSIEWCEGDYDYASYEVDEQGKYIIQELAREIQEKMEKFIDSENKKAIAEYKKEHNITE